MFVRRLTRTCTGCNSRLFPVFPALVGFLLLVTDCTRTTQAPPPDSKVPQVLDRARQFSAVDPDRMLLLLDSLAAAAGLPSLSDSNFGQFVTLRADAIYDKGLKDSAYSYMQHLYNEIQVDERKKAAIRVALWLSQHFMNDGNFVNCRKYLENARSRLKKDTLSFDWAEMLNQEGTLLMYTGDYVNAEKNLLKAIRRFERLGQQRALGAVYINLAMNYQALGEVPLALASYRKAVELTRLTRDSDNFFTALNNLGSLYKGLAPDSAEYYFNRVRKQLMSRPGSPEALSARFNLAGLYYEQKKYDLALATYTEVLMLSQKYRVPSGTYRAMSGIGNVYEAIGRDREALRIYQQSAELASVAGETPIQINLLDAVEYMYNKIGNYREAYHTLKKVRHLNDSLLAKEKQIAVRNLELAYNTEKAERRNESLQVQITIMKNRMRTNSIILALVLIAALILGVLSYAIYRLYRQRDHAYQNLIEQYRKEMQAVGEPVQPLVDGPAVTDLLPDQADEIYRQLVEWFDTYKPYLKSDLRFDAVVTHLRTNRRMLSRVLQNHAGMNFNTFVNTYRVKEALKRLADPGSHHYKIEVLAREVGFGSKTSFYDAFSQITGTTPTEYR